MGKRQRARLLECARPIIKKIADGRTKQTFAYFTADDITQEVWSICLSALDKYDPSLGPLENYLQRCTTNRLKNLRRDKYFRPPTDNLDVNGEVRDRINIVNALPLGGGDVPDNATVLCGSFGQITAPEEAERNEQIAILEAKLPPDVLKDFQRMRAGERLSQARMDRVISESRRIAHESGL